MASVVFNYFKQLQNKPSEADAVDFLNDDIGVILVGDGYVPDVDNDKYLSDVTDEIVGDGYTAGGQLLASKTVTQNNTSDKSVCDAANLTWTNATIEDAAGAIVYKKTGDPEDSTLMIYLDFGGLKTSSNANFDLEFDSAGIYATG